MSQKRNENGVHTLPKWKMLDGPFKTVKDQGAYDLLEDGLFVCWLLNVPATC